MQFYQVNLLKDPNHPGPNQLLEYLRGTLIPDLEKRGLVVYGVFQGLFGLASNELYLVVSSVTVISQQDLDSEFQIIESIDLIPTIRPTDHTRRTREGIYVFRWFDVMNKDVEEIAELSAKAWITFEEGFDTEVQCLFAEQNQESKQGKMLLITWYKNLSVWQESRQPPEDARENFMRRHRLTLQAKPIATRLV
ncbi:MAG: hypothetical protein O6945_12740 [Gammaproteobacteria bacterium]|nr:hypothetical protein [Gammaproteobacteria bacterium]